MKEFFLETDGYSQIAVTVFEPSSPRNKLLVINSATGVKQQVYYSFAKYFAEYGFTVVTYDYSGIGQSKPKNLSSSKATMRTWGTVDFKTITDYVQQHYSDHTKYCLGHSVGALILGMNEGSQIFEKFVFVATQDAYYGHLNLKIAALGFFGFGIAVPIITRFFGYFPADRFGLGESLPSGVALDWRTLILHRKSTSRLLEKISNDFSKHLTQKTLIIHAEDDSWVTLKGMESLMNTVYPHLEKKYYEIKISESPKKEIGHVNFFRSYNRVLWRIVLDEL